MPKQTLLISLIAILGLLGLAWWITGQFASRTAMADTNKVILFYGPVCPRCQELDQWLQSEHIPDQTTFERKNSSTPTVQLELEQAVSVCRFNASQGVELPFLRAKGQCYAGMTAIQQFFQSAKVTAT